jgi:hypothetical protein
MTVQAKVDVEGPATFAGVRVNHPSIVSACKQMWKQGRKLEDIMRVTGMPAEVCQRYKPKN